MKDKHRPCRPGSYHCVQIDIAGQCKEIVEQHDGKRQACGLHYVRAIRIGSNGKPVEKQCEYNEGNTYCISQTGDSAAKRKNGIPFTRSNQIAHQRAGNCR